jgi:hypothetical protein
MPALALFAVTIAAMRSDPVNSITHARRTFDVALWFARIDMEKWPRLKRLHGGSGTIAPINAQ